MWIKRTLSPDWRIIMPRSSCVPVVSGKAYSYPLLPVTTIAPRPIASKNCSAALGSGNTQRRNIAATWSCVMASPLWSWPMTWKGWSGFQPLELFSSRNHGNTQPGLIPRLPVYHQRQCLPNAGGGFGVRPRAWPSKSIYLDR